MYRTMETVESSICEQNKRIWNELKLFQLKQIIKSNKTTTFQIIKLKIAYEIKKCYKQNDPWCEIKQYFISKVLH